MTVRDDRSSLARGEWIDVHDVLTKLFDVLAGHFEVGGSCNDLLQILLGLLLLEVEDLHCVLGLREVWILLLRNDFHFARWSSLPRETIRLDLLIQIRRRRVAFEIPVLALSFHPITHFGLGVGSDPDVFARAPLLLDFGVQVLLILDFRSSSQLIPKVLLNLFSY